MILDFNTRLVVLGAGVLGAVAGMVGVYMLLRRRSLIADAICHASLPGIAIAFLFGAAIGIKERSLPLLLVGAGATGTLGALSVLALRRWTNLKEDAALGIVLSVYFGCGMALLSIVQQLSFGYPAGLEGFIYGKTASIVTNEAIMILATASIVAFVLIVCRKEIQLLCFDAAAAAAQGWPVLAIDLLLIGCVLVVVVIGTSIVGVLLVIALLVIPPAASRFWTHRIERCLLLSALFGASSSIVGALTSLFVDRVPSGAAIVLAASALFAISMIVGTESGLLWRGLRLMRIRSTTDQEHVLRAIYEMLESQNKAPQVRGQTRSDAINVSDLTTMRSWSGYRLQSAIKQVRANGWVAMTVSGGAYLTASGVQQSLRAVRRHRLLEQYFAHWAELSADAIDRAADYTEHALDDELLAQLERDAMATGMSADIPISVHRIDPPEQRS